MKFEFVLLNGMTLPIFSNDLGVTKESLNICLDTGCSLTAFYMNYDTVKKLYPDIQITDETINIMNVNGENHSHSVYIIPEFVLTDKSDCKLYIKNLYCYIDDTAIQQIDVLLSGGVFYNAKIIITPFRDKNNSKIYRVFRADTNKDNKDTLVMQKHKSENGKSLYVGALNVF